MDIDYLSQLHVDLFIKEITYLPFDTVISVCKVNTKLHNYCTNPRYANNWKALIDNTFGNIYNYQEKLNQIRSKLNLGDGVYNYLIYTQLVKVLDPITQLMIYYRQGDMDSFDSPNYNNNQRFLALFLLNRKNKMKDYLPDGDYLQFISMLEGHKIDQNILNNMLAEMAKEGSVQGVFMMSSIGTNIHVDNDRALRLASERGHLEVVKYLVEQGADIHAMNDYALRWSSLKGHLEVVKYLVENGANIHANNDHALRLASLKGYLEVVTYLVEQGANVHANNDLALRWASEEGHLEVVKYLESLD